MKTLACSFTIVKMAASRGISIAGDDADIITKYLGKRGYALLYDDDGKTYRHKYKELMTVGSDKAEEFSIKDAILFAIDINADLQKNESDPEYIDILRLDESVLRNLYELFFQTGELTVYTVKITEQTQKEITVAASSAEEAEEIVIDRWDHGMYVMDRGKLLDVDFKAKMND